MVEEREKASFLERVSHIEVNVDSVERVEVDIPWSQVEGLHMVQNTPGTKNSLKIYVHAVVNGYITPDAAREAMDIYGYAYGKEATENRGMHPNIDVMDNIVCHGQSVVARIVRRE
jgi:hypothetical protein